MQIWNGWLGIGNVTVWRGEKDVCMYACVKSCRKSWRFWETMIQWIHHGDRNRVKKKCGIGRDVIHGFASRHSSLAPQQLSIYIRRVVR
jgi:hypothetical protein